MKTISKLFTLSVLTIVMSCGQSKNMTDSQESLDTQRTSRDNRTDRSDNLSPSQTDIQNNQSNRSSSSTLNDRTDIKSSTDNREFTYNADLDERRQRMYSDLGMTQEQINRYEEGYDANIETWNRDNNNRNISSSERAKHDDKLLKAFCISEETPDYHDIFVFSLLLSFIHRHGFCLNFMFMAPF